MEKTQAMTFLAAWSSSKLGIAILIIWYIVGLVGVTLPIHPDFMLLTPCNMLTTFLVVLWCQENKTKGFGYALLACFIFGYVVEVLGVQTGLLFGEYTYGATLGPKILGTPIIMGLNWTILVYGVVTITNKWLGRGNVVMKSILGATLMVLSDLFIEPVAVKFDFWSWGTAPINNLIVAPPQNYIMWWLAAIPINLIFHLLAPHTNNIVANFLFWLQCFFFAWIFVFVL